ncbi:MAG: NAD(+) diphosphatase [Blautia sp.]|nr:NAD(+) diphosphatase [Blautia sp.]
MLQDILPYHLYNQYHPEEKPDADSFIVCITEEGILLHVEEEKRTVCYPRASNFGKPLKVVYLFSMEGEKFFLSLVKEEAAAYGVPEGFSFYNVRTIRNWNLQPRRYMFAAFTALQLDEWYDRNRYCGKCGKPTEIDDTERAMACKSCGIKIYPRINPAVIVGVRNGDRLLLTKYRTGFGSNALIAGFTEIGETLEETVQREVMEEAGLRVKNIRYYKSQPWGIASDILAGFYCDVDGDDTIRMDESELKYAEWVERSGIELQPVDYSLTNEMMQMFKEGKA